MGRYSPSVERRAPQAASYIDIGDALRSVAGGLTTRWQNEARERERAEAQAQRDEDERYRRGRDNLADTRYTEGQAQAEKDRAIVAADRKRTLERNYLKDLESAKDQGLSGGPEREARQSMYRGIGAGGAEADAAQNFPMQGISEALLKASGGEPRTRLTRPDDTQEALYFDPTQTKDRRDLERAKEVARYTNSLKEPPRDQMAEWYEQMEYKRKHGIGEFYHPPRAGGSGANSPAFTQANTQKDNWQAIYNRVESNPPKRPVWNDTNVRVPGEKDAAGKDLYGPFKADSSAKETIFTGQANAYRAKLDSALTGVMKYQAIGDSLADASNNVRPASGGDSVKEQISAAAKTEIAKEAGRMSAAFAANPNMPDAVRQELWQEYYKARDEILLKYPVLRPKD